MRAIELIDQHLVQNKDYIGERGDMAGIYGAVRIEAGMPYENDPKDEGKAKAEK